MDKIKIELRRNDVCKLLTACTVTIEKYQEEEFEERDKAEEDWKRIEEAHSLAEMYTDLWHEVMAFLEDADG